MITFSETQILAWITPVLWPFLRVLALFGAMPVLAQRAVPVRVRVALSALIVFCAQSSLPAMPVVPLASPTAGLLVAQQVLVGLTLAFAARLVFTAIELAGEVVGLQMGLNFQGFFDPATSTDTTAVSRFFGIAVSWLFIVMNGHLLMVAAVVQSFQAFPVGPEPFAFLKSTQPQVWGAEVFRLGLWIALPIVAMLLFVNLVLGVISRVAQQLSIFSIGFPITLGVGLIGIVATLPMMQAPFTMALEQMVERFR